VDPIPNLPDYRRLTEQDPWLEPYLDGLRRRAERYAQLRQQIAPDGNLMGAITQGHHHFGLNRGEHEGMPGVWYREWAPGAEYLALVGDFNQWDAGADPLTRDQWGIWQRFFPDAIYADRLTHGSRVKAHVGTSQGTMDRIPAYIRRVVQDPVTTNFAGEYWSPPEPYVWRFPRPIEQPRTAGGLRIYEAHVGMAPEDGHVGTFTEFRDNVLPRIADLGYNAIQLMAIMEHPYYGSFGYHVSNFFAVSSRFGTPEELKSLVDAAHRVGLHVVMDIVHSHAVKNLLEGLNRFDGTDHQYFHAGARGNHAAWDSLCFDYQKYEVLRFLLSNVRFWQEEFRMDGFRFDGVTSMLFHDHGIRRTFASYDDYFSVNVDADALAYLTLANEVAHAVDPQTVTIAEDVSGLVGLARPVAWGGIGFDYRLSMGVPDLWIRLLKEQRDEEWSLAEIYHALLNRRQDESSIGYVESHDQALVGDKTIAYWLMDARMYDGMSKFVEDPIIARGLALHKMIRLLTFALAGDGYLNFMGNEFGHPEWIDFPREGNNFSHHYARRQWSLTEHDHLHYRSLQDFDRSMLQLDARFGLLEDPLVEQLALHEDSRQLIFRRGPLVFAFNFHAHESYAGLRIPVPDASDYRMVLDTDALEFGGNGALLPLAHYPWQSVPMYGRDQSLMIYLPARSAQVLVPVGWTSDVRSPHG